jgi:fibronectin type 3 domain-containing protein
MFWISLVMTACSAYAASDITLTWDKVTGATQYKVYRNTTDVFNATVKPNLTVVCDTQLFTCEDKGLTDGKYYWAATALDAAGNESDFSNIVNYDTGDTTPPSAPANLVVKSVTKVTITTTINVAK